MTQATPNNYWISPNALYIELNATGNPDYIQAACISGAQILVYMKGIISFDAGHNYRRWTLQASPTVFNTHSEKYVYAAVPKDGTANQTAFVCFPSEELDVYGKNAAEEQIGDENYYYIFLQGIIKSSGDNGSIQRDWQQRITTGLLSSDEAIAATGTESEWYKYSSVDGIVTFLKNIDMETGKKFLNLLAQNFSIDTGGHISFVGDERNLMGIADENTAVEAEDRIVIPKYLKDNALSRINDDTAQGLITLLKGLKINVDHGIDENGNATLGSLKIGDHGIDGSGNAILGKVVAELMSRFKGGAEFGEFIQGILYGTGGRVDERGNAEFESITSRSSIIAKELIVNRQQAVESDFMFTESGSVESVTEIPPATEGDNTTYDLKLKKRWDNDFTAFHEQDCIRASINTLLEDGKYYDMWFRVLSVNTLTNTISVVMYPDNEVPSGKNYPPCELARLIRWGNPVDEKRQSCWYISSEIGLFVWLDHVTKPIIDKTNYSVAIGKLPDALSFVFQDFPQADRRDGAFYAKWLAVQNIINVDYEGNVQQNVVDRGMWSLATAQGDKPYRATATEVHDVWRNGCKWRCISDKTTEEPKYASTGWAFLEGNPEFTCRISGADQTFDADVISTRDDNGNYPVFTTLSVRGYLYNEDVTDHILAKNVVWTRDTGNTNEDNIWAVSHANAGFSVPLIWEDLGKNAEERLSCSFKVEVAIIDETVNARSGEEKTIKKASDETEI